MRTIGGALQTHLNSVDTTTTRLIKITLQNGLSYGLTTLDRDVTYDDGEYSGEITYIATNGFDAAALSADIGYAVDNSEGYALISDLVPGITLEMVQAGDLDDAQWVCYLVNYEDLSMGHVILDAGDVGEVRTRYGMVWIPELLSYAMRVRQTIGSVWSRKCRAIFGSPADSQTGCGIDITPLWVSGEVLSVGAENDRTFTGDVVLSSASTVIPFPGRVQWLTGANAGREYATEDVDGETVSLNETTPYPIEVGDTYRIRPDCLKRYQQDCIDTWDNGPNFKGEPYIPVGDGASVQTPGAQQAGGGGYVAPATQPPPVVVPSSSEMWPNWPVMNVTALQGSTANTLLDYATHTLLADKDVIMFQSFYPTTTRLTTRTAAISDILSLQSAPMSTKFLQYVIPSVVAKNFPGIPGQGEGEIVKELLDHGTKGTERWYIHLTSDPTSAGRVEDFFNPPDTWATNIGHSLSHLNSLSENFAEAYWKEWNTRWVDGSIDFRTYLAGVFMDNTAVRPLTYSRNDGATDVTNIVDFNNDGFSEVRGSFNGSSTAGGSQYAAGQLRIKNEFEARFPGKFMVPNAGTWVVDYTDGDGAPPLPLSNHPCYRQWEMIMFEVTNNSLGLRRDLTFPTGYKYNGGGSPSTMFKNLTMMEKFLKLDANISPTLGVDRGCVWAQSSMNDRTPTQDDIEFARTMSLIALMLERTAPCVQYPDRPFSLDELLVSFGAPITTRSMGTLNESTLAFTLRTADQSVGVGRFYWTEYQNVLIVFRGDNPTVGVWPSADAAISVTLPSAGGGKKWQRLNAATYVNPITARATRNQTPTLNNGADATSVSLKRYQAMLLLRVDA